ncbi:universal stress protein [Alteromonas aestuariivivens]|uniref:Universal stress protein n=1 Tax=Alteromonas aestuariivivens TaxID=1938339 RepID=A0A3D8M3C0_9ALTE|nr:universal stress protein [Alteromonas aestuariivivens]RDV24118.1 universal stress protein [Alteromonas aestuariivivens]
MNDYQSILVALDVYSDYEPVIERAVRLAGNPMKLNLLYVAYPQTNFEPYGLFLEKDFSEEIRQQARQKLEQIALRHNIPNSHVHVAIGSSADEIHAAADKLGADLIVIGTHGQSGVRLLLGSTANAVLHGVKVDVLAVRI